jgi:hypothetical protein
MKTASEVLRRLALGDRIYAWDVPSRVVFWLRYEGYIQYKGPFIVLTETGLKKAEKSLRMSAALRK